jgi:hypothetical protein
MASGLLRCKIAFENNTNHSLREIAISIRIFFSNDLIMPNKISLECYFGRRSRMITSMARADAQTRIIGSS